MFKQPRVPEYRENEGTTKHLKALTLFLKDFCQDVWTASRNADKATQKAQEGVDSIKYPVTSVNKKTGDVELGAADVGARPSDWMPTAEQVGARASDWMPSASDVGALPSNGTAANASKLGGNVPSYYMKDFGRWETLWSGNWSDGTITVPDTSKYNIFKIAISGQGTAVLAIRQGENIRGIGGYSTATPTVYTFQFVATHSGNEWSFVACNRMMHPDGDISNHVVSSIVGVI